MLPKKKPTVQYKNKTMMANGIAIFKTSLGSNQSLLANSIPAKGEAAGVKKAKYKHNVLAVAIGYAISGGKPLS